MNALLPIIEQLGDALDDQARARWLLACPITVLFKYQDTIINRLRNGFFQHGVIYLEAELALARQVRVGGLPNMDNPYRGKLLDIAGFRASAPAAAMEATEI